ncbi:SPOC domain-containing protein 1 isoform X2 [Dendropsophus ebraccatus]|uniref:SPOC domain-containing protein 1 isoform X2 n=1 Tax=Dendropsophus ebraccatus TaxID=150705 RepID=UPI0038322609
MDNLLYANPSKTEDRDCHSPLGLFDKFKVEFPPDAMCLPDPDLHFNSGLESYSTFKTECTIASPYPNDVNKPLQNKSILFDKMRKMVDMVSPARNRKEHESCALLGSWNPDTKKVETLDELESTSKQTELDPQILIQDVSDSDDVIYVSGEDGKLPQSIVLIDTTGSTDNEQVSDPKLGEKVRKLKKKSSDREKTQRKSIILIPTKYPKTIRDTTVQALYDVLVKRIRELKNPKLPKKTLKKLAENIEEEIFNLYRNTGVRYKTKYRSLLFNLKDPKNEAFFQHVACGEITPQRLVQLTPTEMAPQALTDWRNQERLHALKMIEDSEKELNPKQQKIKLTHKGLIEIDTTPDQMFTLEDLTDSSWYSKKLSSDGKERTGKRVDTTAQHKSHLLDLNCLICMGKIKPSDTMDMNQWTDVKFSPKTSKENSHGEKLLTSEAGKDVENDIPEAKSQFASSTKSAVWKGFIQMFAIKQFKVSAVQVSGYSDHLCQNLPKLITSRGFITQESVWEYVDLIWPASTKDMCLLRFCPQTSSDAVFYSRLFSYLNRKVRYVIVDTHKMEAFVIPLPACQPIPSKLRPLGGPGLDDNHPHLLLILLLPNHPSWSSCPNKVRKIQKDEELDVPDDIFSSILEDVEREERQMAEQGLPPIGEDCTRVAEVGLTEVMNILCFLSNNMQESAVQNNNHFHMGPLDNQPNPIPTAAPVWPLHPMAPGFQAPASCEPNPAQLFDPSTMFGPSGFNPFAK